MTPTRPGIHPPLFANSIPAVLTALCVAFMDAELGKFFAFLKQSGLWSKTLIVVVADHGESLGEHGEETHGFFIYDATVRVPFLVRLPFALPQKRLAPRVELTDVAPTILQALGFEIPRSMQGHSLLDLILGKPTTRPDTAYSETYYPRIHFGWSELTAFLPGRHEVYPRPARGVVRPGAGPRGDPQPGRNHGMWKQNACAP